MNDPFDEFLQVFQVLWQDVITCADNLKTNDTQFWRRTYVRTAFALIEGFSYRMKQIALRMHELRGNVFSEDEIPFITEEFYESNLSDKGEVKTTRKKKFIPIENNFKFAFKVYARALDSNYVLDLGDGGWDSFKSSLEIRHRLSHPKFIHQLEISDDELQKIENAFSWYRKVTLELFKVVVGKNLS